MNRPRQRISCGSTRARRRTVGSWLLCGGGAGAVATYEGGGSLRRTLTKAESRRARIPGQSHDRPGLELEEEENS